MSQVPYGPQQTTPAPFNPADSKRVVCGILAILIGGLGIHKFIIGKTSPGLVMLLVSLLTCGIGGIAMHVIAIIEGIKYLQMNDEQFYYTYVVGPKNWM
jgi:TM2 domain-containing membrane protein YozV